MAKPLPKKPSPQAGPPKIVLLLNDLKRLFLPAAGIAVLWFMFQPFAAGARGMGGVLARGWAIPSGALVRALVVNQAGAVAVFLVLVASLWAIGRAVTGWIGAGAVRSIETPVSFLIGAGAGAIVLLGLLLVRVWFPAVMGAALLIPAGVALLVRRPAVPLDLTVESPGWIALLPVVLVFPWLLTPELQTDAWEYFLNGPDRWIHLHGFSVRGATPPLHYPFVAEMLYAIPLLFARDHVARWLNGLVLVSGIWAAATVFGVRLRHAFLVALTSATSVYALTCGKNEGFQAGAILLAVSCGWLAVRRGSSSARALSGIFAGLAISTKYLAGLNVAWVPVLLWWESPRRLIRPWIEWGLVAVAVVSPWLLKTWLMTGDPAYPVLSGFFPSIITGWDLRNAQVWKRCTEVAMAPSMFWDRFGAGLVGEHPVVAVALPFLLWRPGLTRRLTLASLAVYAVWYAVLWNPQTTRWAFSSMGILLILAAGEWGRWLDQGRLARATAVLCLVAGAAASLAKLSFYPNPIPYAYGGESRDGFIGRELTSFMDVRRALAPRSDGKALLLVGEVREYELPRPCLVALSHASGEAPLIWRLVNASSTLRDLEVRFRQLNVNRVAYNYVSVKLAQMVLAPFVWDDRMLTLYEAFCRKHLRLAGQSVFCNFWTGGYCWYDLDPVHDIGGPASTYFLPGAEAQIQRATFLHNAGRGDEALAALLALVKAHPGVGSFRSELGYEYSLRHDHLNAYQAFKPAMAVGVRDSVNGPSFGLAACSIGKFDEGRAVLDRSLDAYPDFAETIRVALADAINARALTAVRAGKLAEAERELGEAERYLTFEPQDPASQAALHRGPVLAATCGLLGDLARTAGNMPRAIAYLRKAYRLAPQSRAAEMWRQAADQLSAAYPAAAGAQP